MVSFNHYINPIQTKQGPFDPGPLQGRVKILSFKFFIFAFMTFSEILSAFIC